MLTVQITSEINSAGLDKRFAEDIKLKDVKNKLVLITGVETDSMQIELYVDNQLKGELTNENQTLGDAINESNAEQTIAFARKRPKW